MRAIFSAGIARKRAPTSDRYSVKLEGALARVRAIFSAGIARKRAPTSDRYSAKLERALACVRAIFSAGIARKRAPTSDRYLAKLERALACLRAIITAGIARKRAPASDRYSAKLERALASRRPAGRGIFVSRSWTRSRIGHPFHDAFQKLSPPDGPPACRGLVDRSLCGGPSGRLAPVARPRSHGNFRRERLA